MRKIVILIALIALVSCRQAPQVTHQVGESLPSAPDKIERVFNHPNYFYEIIKVEGHLYLCNQKGGIVHMESCPCKTNLGKIY